MKLFSTLLTFVISAVCISAAGVAHPAQIRSESDSLVSIQPVDLPTSYNGIRVLRLALPTDEAVEKLRAIVEEEQLEVMSERGSTFGVGEAVDVLVPVVGAKKEAFDSVFDGEDYTVVHEDLGKAIEEEKEGFAPERSGSERVSAALADLTWFNNYHPYADHLTFINELAAAYPNITEKIVAGNSYEGKPITGLHLFGSSGKGVKPAIIFHGNVHAREWISSKTVEYILYQLLTGYSTSADVKSLIDSYDFYIFPVANPDGFSFSQTNTRLWRKNRRPPPRGSSCYGVDLNRNWGIKWSESGGASTSACAEDYKGTAVESEPEIQAFVAFSKNLVNTTGIKLYIDYHSYGQLFLYPYGYSCTTNPDSSYYQAKGKIFQDALRPIRSTRYSIEQACTLYKTTGASDDYHYGTLGVWDAYTIELPNTSTFVLPASQILPTGRETWEGTLALLKSGFH